MYSRLCSQPLYYKKRTRKCFVPWLKMDAVPCSWNTTRVQESFARTKPASDALTKLAKLVAQKQESKSQNQPLPDVCPCVCAECGQGFSDMAELLHHQQGEHALPKRHRCLSCGKEFSLLSSLQLHKCFHDAAPCQVCCGKPQLDAPCNACKASTSDSQNVQDKSLHHQSHHHDSRSYACAPCGKGFSQKQALLHHQQAGCSKSASRTAKVVSPPADSPSPESALSDSSPPDSPPSDSPSPDATSAPVPDGPSLCPLCSKSFRSGAGLACHQRSSHQKEWSMSKYLPPKGGTNGVNRKSKQKSQLLSCRSCEKVFPSTAKLYLHRQESHSREKDIRRDPRPLISKRRKRETYPCDVCGKVFLHHLSLKAHVKNHSQEPPSHVQQVGKATKEPKLAEKMPKKTKSNLSRKMRGTLVKASRGRPKKIPMKEEEGEFPCPSCAEVFSLQSALKEHEELHQPTGSMRHCSVCSQGMSISKKPGAKLRRAYHCVPCLKAFVTLDTFLQHCQDHLVVSGDEERSYSDTDGKI
ncbi:zinc finger and SCAN domain-containing protein 10-like isoform X2 [Oncorhynchus keta]|uniref:zinc finger and SCAN domain-containing protein 10-like isoform X2 n=1 Tax=Oncorhynchus keta TaxID=8018 RepID=UPI0015FB16E6|nr:zinc finger and SCAN domain-containing protein 10-like isoform X2 [Oncorhynchus keta]